MYFFSYGVVKVLTHTVFKSHIQYLAVKINHATLHVIAPDVKSTGV